MSTSTTADVNANLKALTDAGVSVWLDQISRELVAGGELARLVAQDSLRGVTSNPTIFLKAIVDTNHYDELIQTLASQGQDAKTIYDAIAVGDVQRAADTLRPVFDASGGHDGFVSLEVQPDVAHDTDATLESARTYWKAADRPNVMIKIPGTPEGVGAIEQAIYEGININITLLFSVAAYQAIAEAYIRGLERRRAEGKSLDMASVASFFVSRVDTNADKKLEAIGGEATKLAGTAALANARAAYARFKEIFSGDALGVAGRSGRGPSATTVGVDRDQEPGLLRHDVRRSADRPSHRQHDASGDAARVCRPRHGSGDDRRDRPERRPRGARAGWDRHGEGHRRAAGRRDRPVRRLDEQPAGRDRAATRSVR